MPLPIEFIVQRMPIVVIKLQERLELSRVLCYKGSLDEDISLFDKTKGIDKAVHLMYQCLFRNTGQWISTSHILS